MTVFHLTTLSFTNGISWTWQSQFWNLDTILRQHKENSTKCWPITKRISSSSHWRLTCSRYDIAD